MAAAVSLRDDFDGPALRRLAKVTKDAAQARRLLALAEVCDGGSRSDAARVGGVGLQTIRDWVLRFNPHCGQDQMDLRALGISAASFASAVTIEQIDDDTLITLQGEGSILCSGINGEEAAVIDQSDFLLLA